MMRHFVIAFVFLTLYAHEASAQTFTPNAVLRIFNVTFVSGGATRIASTETDVYGTTALALSTALPSNSVIITNACDFSGNPCHADATCTDINATQGIIQCKCNDGYNQTASTMTFTNNDTIIPDGTNCPDIDECANATVCGAQTSNCTNSPGNYTCTCNSGYELSSSKICIDINECATNTSNCASDATCTNTEGNFTCSCNTGFTGDGTTCSDINECNASGCDSQANCTNTPGSFSCVCNSGYSGNGVGGGSCTDIDECLSNPCDGNATCDNTGGSFTCTCNTGFSGNGTFCEDASNDYYYRLSITVSTATTGTVSSRRSEVETAASDLLSELTNSSSLGFSVTSSSQELEGVLGNTSVTEFIVVICLNGSSKTAAELTNILSSFTFTTQIGSLSITVLEYNECLTNYGNCSTNANCTNTDGDFTCECFETHADRSTSGVNGTICDLPTSFTCTANSVNVTAYLPYFTNLGINETELLLGNCSGTVSGSDLSFTGGCDPSISENSTHLFFAWNLTNVDSSASLTIGQYVTIPVTCTFLSSQNVTFNVSSERRDIVFSNTLNNQPGQNIGFTASPFFDTSATNAVSGPVQTDQTIYFSLGSSGTLPDTIRIQCDSFYTSPASDPSQSVELIRDGCNAPTTSDNSRILSTLDIVQQGTGSSAVIGVRAHFFGTSTVTLAHFGVVACSEAGGSTCAIGCSRRKRSIITLRTKREEVERGEVVAAFQRDPDDVCNRPCGKGICVLDAALQAQCVCADQSYKVEDGTCVQLGVPVEPASPAVVTDRTTLWVLIGLACILVVMVIALIAAFFLRRRSSSSKNYDMH